MSTHRSTWKRRERDGAAVFGASRQPGSGSSGRADERIRNDPAGPGRDDGPDGPTAGGSQGAGKGATMIEPTGPGERPGGAGSPSRMERTGAARSDRPGRDDRAAGPRLAGPVERQPSAAIGSHQRLFRGRRTS